MNMKQLSHLSPAERMIQEQLVGNGIRDERVLDAFRHTPREQFFPADLKDRAFDNDPAPIGHGQTISQPYIVALMTERLDVRPEHKVLEIGTGSGYQTALLARLAGEVYTVERIKPLLDIAFERLLGMGHRNVHFRYGDGAKGWPEHAPYDRLLIAAGAPELPKSLLLTQLIDGGTAILPVGPLDKQVLLHVRRRGDKLEQTEVCHCRFVKLIGEGAWEDR
jgi:protein-L-isoaspartate(D-aspartate) O-methyltransferase